MEVKAGFRASRLLVSGNEVKSMYAVSGSWLWLSRVTFGN